MQYRTLGRTGLQVSEIGLGTEHMIQQREVMSEVLSVAVDAGLSYVDLLYIDPSGDDAAFWEGIGPALRQHRDKLVLAAHWGGGPRYDLEYCRRTFPEVLSRVGNDYVEVAMMTMIDEEDRRGAWLDASLADLRRYQAQGHVGWIGGSAHDLEQAIALVQSGRIDVLMFPLNLTMHVVEAVGALYEACAAQGVGLVAMKPYAGGLLLNVDGQPTSIRPEQCLSYVLSLPVSTAVPGVRNADHMRAALRYCAAREPERDHHCFPCPADIPIDTAIMIVDWAKMGVSDELRGWYAALPAKGSDCIQCGDCMARCPFGVDVIAKMERAVALFE